MDSFFSPRVSVLMAANCVDNYLLDAVKSVLNQTLREFEMIFVANGLESKEVAEYVRGHVDDNRLIVVESPIGQLANALNIGLAMARSDYIARMDADDVAVPERLERQLQYLERYRLDLIGCDLVLIDENDKVIGNRVYPKGREIDGRLPFSNCFAHNTILAKKDLLLKVRGYNSGFNTEDYDLWLRLLRIGAKWDNMPDCLVQYRIHEGSSQRRLLGYAEATGLAMREFILEKSIRRFLALMFHVLKSFVRPTRL
ncbi:MAG TPA: glycosyltransferase [Aromatoleum sp.]|uniref:glycosyltransferase n=1 Tax=Aromatoleum sp. TaxID=2307007 RepID=UPI002B489908|nr:glycosyltransferase [Aromatoleum sp.]HJV25101.1 glycosyltransferase [Aromatoleum sp.]